MKYPKILLDLSGQACATCKAGVISLVEVTHTETTAHGTFDIPVLGYTCSECANVSLPAESKRYIEQTLGLYSRRLEAIRGPRATQCKTCGIKKSL